MVSFHYQNLQVILPDLHSMHVAPFHWAVLMKPFSGPFQETVPVLEYVLKNGGDAGQDLWLTHADWS